ncbi:MAG: helix-turn-helix transcriptional regulator [Clostridiales bacterium]|nr:helix-turn-helix transcriptional regulator [Clostridiales bacterium]
MGNNQHTTDGLIQELRRGTLVLSVLSQLKRPQYGYSLVQCLAQKGLNIEQSTLYPLLRRLEKQELLKSDWELTGTRPRRYYQLNENGKEMLQELSDEWNRLAEVVKKLTQEEEIK